MKKVDNRRAKFTPTPEQIEASAAEIRKSWSDKEYEKRFGREKHVPWITPTINTNEIDLDNQELI
jgi:hypothetical protein